MGPPGWVVGPAVALGTLLFAMGTPLAAIGIIGFLLVPAIAMWAGAAAASLVDSRRRLNAIVVVAATLVVYVILVGRLQSQPPPPGTSYGGPTVPAPASMGGATVPP
jgi:hypothetical protein